jgi:hypothetical protein
MSKSRQQKKQRRRDRKQGAALEQTAKRLEQEVGAPAEAIAALKAVATLEKKLGTIRGKREIKAKHARTK